MIQCSALAQRSSPPRIAFQAVRNNTSELINTDMFLDRMRSEMVRFSEGRALFLDRELVDAVESENRARRRGGSAAGDTGPLAADYFLTGQVDDIGTTAGTERIKYWRLSFRLTDAKSTLVVWQDDYEIKKYERRALGQ